MRQLLLFSIFPDYIPNLTFFQVARKTSCVFLKKDLQYFVPCDNNIM